MKLVYQILQKFDILYAEMTDIEIFLLSDLLYVMFRHVPIGFGACRKIL